MSLSCLVLLAVFMAGTPEPESFEQVRPVMGTVARVRVWAAPGIDPEPLADEAFAAFARVDSLMSTWRPDSEISALNRAPAGTWVRVGQDLLTVLLHAVEVARISGGAFDPTVLPLVQVWGFRSGEPAIPDTATLASVRGRVGHAMLEIDGEKSRARFLSPGMAADLGAIAKGYALDLAAVRLRQAGAVAGHLDLGGNILVFGTEAAGEVAVRDPRGTGALLSLPVSDESVATSGQYERFVTIDGRRYGHILDPRTGHPVPGGLSVTVVCAQAVLADALATAAVVLGSADGLALLESTPGVEGIMVQVRSDTEPRILTTSGLEPAH